MGILDPDGFAGGEMRLDADLARRAFEALDTPLSLEQRVAFAYRIAVANIAEEVTNVAIRHGVDPRDFTLVAYGAAGPMLLPAALELLHVQRRRRPAAPGALLGARPAEHRPRLLRQPQRLRRARPGDGADDLDGLRGDGAAAARHGPASARNGVAVRRSFDGRLLGQSWETPFVEVPERADHGGDDPRADRALPRRVRAPLRQPLRVRAGPGRHLPRAARRPGREGRVPGPARSAPRSSPSPIAGSSCATSRTSPLTAGEYERETTPGRRARRGPGDHPRGALDDARLPGPGRPRSAASASSSIEAA